MRYEWSDKELNEWDRPITWKDSVSTWRKLRLKRIAKEEEVKTVQQELSILKKHEENVDKRVNEEERKLIFFRKAQRERKNDT